MVYVITLYYYKTLIICLCKYIQETKQANSKSLNWHEIMTPTSAYGIDLIRSGVTQGLSLTSWVTPVKRFAKLSGGKWSWAHLCSWHRFARSILLHIQTIHDLQVASPRGKVSWEERDPRTKPLFAPLFKGAQLHYSDTDRDPNHFLPITAHDCQLFLNDKNVTFF